MPRQTFIAAATLALLAGPVAAQEVPRSGGTLVWGHSETTQNLDIHQTGTASTGRVLGNIHESLLTVDETLSVIPQLATDWAVSDDGLTYTFTLREGVTFHDGSPMTSADVKYSFERVMAPETGAVNFEVFNDVDSIETPDDTTVVIEMARINAPFLSRIAENGAGAIIPEGSGAEQGTAPVGTGPFTFVRREFGNEVELARFDGYWGEPAYLDTVIAREITEPTVRLTGLETGELDMINDIPADRFDQVAADGDLEVLTWFPLNFDFVNYNHAFEPFQDPEVRRAFDLMIDKEMLLEGALWGLGETTASPSFPTSASYNAALVQRDQDLEEARRLLEAAGHDDLEVTFKVTTNYPYHVESAQIMAEWFRMAGVTATIEQLTWSDWLSQVWTEQDFEISMMNFFTLWEPDFLYYSLWNSEGAFNYRNISDPEIDRLTAEARQVIDPEARAEIYKEVQQIIFDRTHDTILWFRNGTVGAQTAVRGLDTLVHPNGSVFRFHRVWLAQD